MNPADGDFADTLRKLMALPRYGPAEEIAALVVYLAGPEAGFVTGASLAIDGGFTAHERGAVPNYSLQWTAGSRCSPSGR